MEYALIIAVVAAALFAMQIYMKRGMENRLRRSTDDIGKQFEANKTAMFRSTNRTGGSTYEYTDVNGTQIHMGYQTGSGGEQGTGENVTVKASENIAAW